MYVRIDSMNIWKTRKLQYQNIWTNDLEDGMTTLVMTLDLHNMCLIVFTACDQSHTVTR